MSQTTSTDHWTERVNENLTLDGEIIRRKDTGLEVLCSLHKKTGYWKVYCGWSRLRGTSRVAKRSQVKFFLKHGYLPIIVDHRDGDRQNDLLDNLRAATSSQNLQNKKGAHTRARSLPRFVHLVPGGRYSVLATHLSKPLYLGTYDSPEEASRVGEEWAEKSHGEFYVKP